MLKMAWAAYRYITPQKINPFKLKKNSSNFRITALNIKGMRIGTNFEQTKLKALINDGGDVTLIIDHHLDNEKLKSLNKKNRQILSKFNFHGTPTLKRGILILTKKSSGIKISNITHHNNKLFLCFILLPLLSGFPILQS